MLSSTFPQVMVSVAQNLSLSEVLQSITGGLATCTNVVLTRIWLKKPGDICEKCLFLSECPDRTNCLHLVASAGNSKHRTDHQRLNGAFQRFPLGVRKVGLVGKTGEPILMTNLQGSEDWIVDCDWFRNEEIKTFAAQPLVYRGDILGVLGLFDSGVLSQLDFEWLRVFSAHAAVSIANARAFEEIEYLKARLEEENNYLREEITGGFGGGIIGNSSGLQKVMQQIQLVAPTDAAVLITGESGTGKELVANAIHAKSPRHDRVLIKVNCGAVPDTLFESEFFGHVRGSFTGALKDRPGRFELADGGTLFLDEIGEVPLPMQAKLLRVLQEKEIERVGDTRTRKINVRIVAATNRDLRKEVDAGRFRQDLYYRLSVFPLDIPPLRERREDIPPLIIHFIKYFARRMNRPVPKITQASINQLTSYDWPGNVRELQNTIERAMILSKGGILGIEPSSTSNHLSVPVKISPKDGETILTRDQIRNTERANIIAALLQTNGKVFGNDGAAAILGMKPSTLASRIKALNITK